jgi:hypothetical protein
MRIGKKTASMAAAGALAAGALCLGVAPPAQAATCDDPPSGSMCVHIHNLNTGKYYWFGPWYYCTVHNIPHYDQITWVSDNQYTGTVTTFVAGDNGTGGPTASVQAPYYGRPPWWDVGEFPGIGSVIVC